MRRDSRSLPSTTDGADPTPGSSTWLSACARSRRGPETPRARSFCDTTAHIDRVGQVLTGEAEALVARLPPDEEAARYLRDEMRVAIDALKVGVDFARTDDRWGAWVFGRVVVETAIRLSWLTAMKQGERPTPEFVRQRIRRIEKRDWQFLLAFSEIQNELLSSFIFEDEDQVRAEIESIGSAAPDLRTMAEETGLGGVYLLHRLCSAAAHPGIGTRGWIADVYPADDVLLMLRWSFAAAVVGLLGVMDIVFEIDPSLARRSARFFLTRNEAAIWDRTSST